MSGKPRKTYCFIFTLKYTHTYGRACTRISKLRITILAVIMLHIRARYYLTKTLDSDMEYLP